MIMKGACVALGTVLGLLMAGCSTTPMAVAPVGPNPNGAETQRNQGQLEVYSFMAGHAEGNNPTWYQHTDYTIYDQAGREVEHIRNSLGRYESVPRQISLPPGRYIVKAEAKDWSLVSVPIVVKAGRVTKVHLDDAWRPAVAAANVVRLPNGQPVGWSAK